MTHPRFCCISEKFSGVLWQNFCILQSKLKSTVIYHLPAAIFAVCNRMDYSKLKVAELKDLLTSRSLPLSGKKEDLITRLTESDAKTRSAADDLGDLAPPEEEYDWDAPAPQSYVERLVRI